MNIFRLLGKKAQELPMSTLIIIILVVLVLVAVAIIFFSGFTSGQSGISTGTTTAEEGAGVFGGMKAPWD
jgi:flagellar basal body-associated protein FliL